jgi:cytochrome c biogenesis protein CcmG/thiol:disulfide interchange protein DsbE
VGPLDSFAIGGPAMRNDVTLLVTGIALAIAAPVPAKEPSVGEPAPPFELTLVDGGKTSLAAQRGQVVVLNYWATWCGPCKRELPLLDAYYRAQRDFGLRVFAITTEDSVPVARLRPLFAAMAIPSARRMRGPYRPIGGAVPTNYVIDRAGIVRYAKAGAFDLDELNAVLVPLLRESPPPEAPPPITPRVARTDPHATLAK